MRVLRGRLRLQSDGWQHTLGLSVTKITTTTLNVGSTEPHGTNTVVSHTAPSTLHTDYNFTRSSQIPYTPPPQDCPVLSCRRLILLLNRCPKSSASFESVQHCSVTTPRLPVHLTCSCCPFFAFLACLHATITIFTEPSHIPHNSQAATGTQVPCAQFV